MRGRSLIERLQERRMLSDHLRSRGHRGQQTLYLILSSSLVFVLGLMGDQAKVQAQTVSDDPQPSCDDGIRNGEESDIDCGGVCTSCGEGSSCLVDGDCQFERCVNQLCVAPSCDDGLKNQDESDVDCGGELCEPCSDGLRCQVNSDCLFDQCLLSTCVAPSCDDGVQGLGESDIDCGGLVCARCEVGERCGSHADCESRRCASSLNGKRCVAPSCDDFTQNGDESDVDCGGRCETCPHQYTCQVDEDCESSRCSSRRCAVPSCDDQRRNGSETDVDCGGVGCLPCGTTSLCELDRDCESGLCLGQRCAAPTCFDLRLNQNEIEIDCGGVCAPCEGDDLDMSISIDHTVMSEDMEWIESDLGREADMAMWVDLSIQPELDMGEVADFELDMQFILFDLRVSESDMEAEEVPDGSILEITLDQGVTPDQSSMLTADAHLQDHQVPMRAGDDEVYDPSVFARERPRSGCDLESRTREQTSCLLQCSSLIILLLTLSLFRRRVRISPITN